MSNTPKMAVAFVDSKTLKNFKINWLTFPTALLNTAKKKKAYRKHSLHVKSVANIICHIKQIM